jgi:hypothetical protein
MSMTWYILLLAKQSSRMSLSLYPPTIKNLFPIRTVECPYMEGGAILAAVALGTAICIESMVT